MTMLLTQILLTKHSEQCGSQWSTTGQPSYAENAESWAVTRHRWSYPS